MTVDYGTGVYMHTESGGLLIGKADKEEPASFNENVDYGFLEKVAELAMSRVPASSHNSQKPIAWWRRQTRPRSSTTTRSY